MFKPYFVLILLWALAITLISLLSGCKSSDIKVVPPAPVVEVAAKIPANIQLAWGDNRLAWTQHLMEELENRAFLEIVPADYSDYCANFEKLSKEQRAEFYAQLISIMAKRESGFNPQSKYQEAFNDAKGKPVISRGLLQISIESANSYNCRFKDATELHDPLKNLSCTVKIIERWIERDKRLGGKVADKWQGIARYWSVGRSVSRSFPVVQGYVSKLRLCAKD